MILRRELSSRWLLTIGMASLVAALWFPRLVGTGGSLGPDGVDAIQGCFFGLSIGFNLVWVATSSKRRETAC